MVVGARSQAREQEILAHIVDEGEPTIAHKHSVENGHVRLPNLGFDLGSGDFPAELILQPRLVMMVVWCACAAVAKCPLSKEAWWRGTGDGGVIVIGGCLAVWRLCVPVHGVVVVPGVVARARMRTSDVCARANLFHCFQLIQQILNGGGAW